MDKISVFLPVWTPYSHLLSSTINGFKATQSDKTHTAAVALYSLVQYQWVKISFACYI
jgi:hypothetical protein